MKTKLMQQEPGWVRLLLIALTWSTMLLLIILPLIAIFFQAFSAGWEGYYNALSESSYLSALKLTLICLFFALLFNSAFGILSGWAIGKFYFSGKKFLISLIDLPLSISPVVSGLLFLLLFGPTTVVGKYFYDMDVQIIYALPGIVIVTVFVTLPYISRELIPIMLQQGTEEEEVARLLGATATKIFLRVTLPNIKWSLFYGLLICGARALGEFGAVSVVSGHIQGRTNTIPLHVEILYNDYDFQGAFAAASTLTIVAIITIFVKGWLDRKYIEVDKESTLRNI